MGGLEHVDKLLPVVRTCLSIPPALSLVFSQDNRVRGVTLIAQHTYSVHHTTLRTREKKSVMPLSHHFLALPSRTRAGFFYLVDGGMGCGGSRATYMVIPRQKNAQHVETNYLFVEHSFLVGWSTAYSIVHSMPRPKAAHRSVKTLSLGHEVSGKREVHH